MKLDIYDKRAVVKTYTTDTYDLLFGTLEDVADAIRLDEIKSGTDAEIIRMAGKLVIESMDTVCDLLKDMFPGITDDEIRRARVADIAQCLVDVVRFTIRQLSRGFGSKN